MQVVHVKMQEVKRLHLAKHVFQHDDVVRQLIHAVPIEAQGAGAGCHEMGCGHRITAGE
jgi:hypothetical protein